MTLSTMVLLAGCAGDGAADGSDDTGDTGLPVCGRIRGTKGVLMYQIDGGQLIVRSPLDSPNEVNRTTGVAGPVGDDRTWLAVNRGEVIRSENAGCDWDEAGSVPVGDWGLVLAGATVYAFERASSQMARTDDLGISWSPTDTTEVFVDLPVADTDNGERLRGVQTRGIVTSDDGGASWPVSGSLPDEMPSPVSASLDPGNLERLVIGGDVGVMLSVNGGTSWESIYDAGEAVAVAIHPDDPEVVFALARDADGVLSGWRHDGTDWEKLVTEAQIAMGDGMRIWPIPGDPATAATAHGPVANSDGVDSLALYLMTPDGTTTTRVTTFFHMHQLGFGSDRWVAGVDSVP